MKTLVWVTRNEVLTYSMDEVPSELGPKAAGLLEIPSAWTPDFVVVSPTLVSDYATASTANHAKILTQWCARITEALRTRGIDPGTALLLRSNAVTENLGDRGSYCSRQSDSDELRPNLDALLSDLLTAAPDVPIGLIVQEYVKPVMKGHLSNERRVARDFRDAEILSTMVETGEMAEHKIVHRNWRRSNEVDDSTLWCKSWSEIKKVLREPLALAARSSKRMHYEWVWDGDIVYIVQADEAPHEVDGEIPGEHLKSIAVHSSDLELRSFVIASGEGWDGVGKLRSHMKYKTHGFWQPTFYVLDDAAALSSIIQGVVPTNVETDLRQLVSTPLMIRTAYCDETVPLLPRSPVLADINRAIEWLVGRFAHDIRRKELTAEGVTLLAHHFIPALAAAFSHATPDKSDVLIEALWGVPEGLYYFPCDDFIVSTPASVSLTEHDFKGFSIRERIQFKSHFVEPDEHGRFRRHRVRKPWDWKRTIHSESVLYRMAHFTRSVAQEAGHGVNIMWFLGCRTPEGEKEVIPWYQERQDELDHGSVFHQNARDEVVTISTSEDLGLLQSRSASPDSGHLILKLAPSEHVALRDESFARQVGTEASRLRATVLLKGARLAHIYYVLKKSGAEVVTKPIGEDTHVPARYTKLVRDKIPEKVAAGGESVTVARLSPEERWFALKLKLIEEAFEVRDAGPDDIVEELADVYEVLSALVQAAGVDVEDVEIVRASKAKKRGAFDKGMQLLETGHPDAGPAPSSLLNDEDAREVRLLRSGRARPFEVVTLGGSDRRRGSVFKEFVRDLSVSLSRSSWKRTVKASGFRDVNPDVATVSIDGSREGMNLKLRIKLQVGKEQLELPLTPHGKNPGDDRT